MTDDPKQLRRRLEEATAPDSPWHVPMDDETGPLREGWLAMGRLLETAQPMDEPFQLRPAARRSMSPWWSMAALAAMVASLVVGVTLAWILIRGNPPEGPNMAAEIAAEDVQFYIGARDGEVPEEVPEAAPKEITSGDAPSQVAPSQVAPSQVAPSRVAADDEFDWGDSFDDQLALVSEEIIRVEQDWYQLDNPFESILDALDQIQEDFDNETL